MNTVESLKQLYVKMGGNLTDSYPEIASGIPVSDYVLIPDCISALNEVAGSGGGANVLTLYAQLDENEDLIAYKDEEMTQPFSTYEEAETAVKNAGAIKVYRRSKAGFGAPSWAVESYFNGVSVVTVRIFSKDTPNPTFLSVYLCKADVGEVNPN